MEQDDHEHPELQRLQDQIDDVGGDLVKRFQNLDRVLERAKTDTRVKDHTHTWRDITKLQPTLAITDSNINTLRLLLQKLEATHEETIAEQSDLLRRVRRLEENRCC